MNDDDRFELLAIDKQLTAFLAQKWVLYVALLAAGMVLAGGIGTFVIYLIKAHGVQT